MDALLAYLARCLPRPLRTRATPDSLALAAQFVRFATVGLAGLVVDTTTVYALRGTLGLYGAGLAAYGTGATTTWWLNRLWTFRAHTEQARAAPGRVRLHRQWALFLLANSAGFVLNRGTYALLVTFVPVCAAQPVLATSAGAVAGMFVNFAMSRSVVFRAVPAVAPGLAAAEAVGEPVGAAENEVY
ncbi:GtrA family protein [Acidisphaera rubrifaciens]|uniref:GtrA/DPMS transmembrane domain-containing protein n=1 Tax=Acidisphaera rubrifaciens HS-AP3 TaxID=1231350 RepID=A0A0D6P8Z4_9PROT|nr:GtrA family protein [Acidisphaera rubrifaciens]GAN78235.1 hypothetical protein Asru_0695_02 [Acidisphaera rubrifaciens HS-AP3]